MSKEKKFMSIMVHIITRDIDLASGGKKKTVQPLDSFIGYQSKSLVHAFP